VITGVTSTNKKVCVTLKEVPGVNNLVRDPLGSDVLVYAQTVGLCALDALLAEGLRKRATTAISRRGVI